LINHWLYNSSSCINKPKPANDILLEIAKTAALISFIVIRQTDVSTCQHYVYNIEEQKKKKK
jgi:hypothetical protein